MTRERTVRRQGGFTMIEVMVSLALLIIGFAGILALYMSTVAGNRASRQLERSRVLAAQLMEDLRGQALGSLGGDGVYAYDTITAAEGVTYTRSYEVQEVTGDLVRLITRVTYADQDDPSQTISAVMQLVRSKHDNL
jgi:prepilin-type N-terminal cleavage/methylation domain-containing protein